MPIQRGFDSQGCYYQYGDTGAKYHYRCGNEEARQRAYDKARAQEIAIGEFSIIRMKKWRNTAVSSNVDKIMYNDETNELVIKFNSGDYYTYYDINFQEFINVIDGNAVCRTSGESRWGSWDVGKTPSVGAAVYEYLVSRGVRYTRGGSLR